MAFVNLSLPLSHSVCTSCCPSFFFFLCLSVSVPLCYECFCPSLLCLSLSLFVMFLSLFMCLPLSHFVMCLSICFCPSLCVCLCAALLRVSICFYPTLLCLSTSLFVMSLSVSVSVPLCYVCLSHCLPAPFPHPFYMVAFVCSFNSFEILSQSLSLSLCASISRKFRCAPVLLLLHFSSVCRLQNLDSNSFKFFIFYFVQLYLLNLVLLCLSSGTDLYIKGKEKKTCA